MEKIYSKGEIEAKNIDKAKDSALRDVKNEKLSVDEIYENAKKEIESDTRKETLNRRYQKIITTKVLYQNTPIIQNKK